MTQGRDPLPSLSDVPQMAPPYSPGRAASRRERPPNTTSPLPGRKALYEALPEPSTVEGKTHFSERPSASVSPVVNKALGGKDHGRDDVLGPHVSHTSQAAISPAPCPCQHLRKGYQASGGQLCPVDTLPYTSTDNGSCSERSSVQRLLQNQTQEARWRADTWICKYRERTVAKTLPHARLGGAS